MGPYILPLSISAWPHIIGQNENSTYVLPLLPSEVKNRPHILVHKLESVFLEGIICILLPLLILGGEVMAKFDLQCVNPSFWIEQYVSTAFFYFCMAAHNGSK